MNAPRNRVLDSLPRGSLHIGAGLAVAGVTAYGFLVLSARALGPQRYSSLSALWVLAFTAGPGFFLPLEQELTRAVAARRARGLGSSGIVRRAAIAGGAVGLLLVAASIAAWGPVVDRLFDGHVLLLAGLSCALGGYFVQHLVRGLLAGGSRFGAYGLVLGAEGAARLAACAALFAAGVARPGPYGLILGLAPWIAVVPGVWRQRGLVNPGAEAEWTELTRALGSLVTASVFAQLLVNAGPLAVKLLAADSETEAAGRFLAGLVIARVPLFLFLAVQAAALPKLSALAAQAMYEDFASSVSRLVRLVVVLGVAAIGGAFALGPQVVRFLFGAEFTLGRRDLTLLASATAVYILALALAQGLIALSSPGRVAVSWLAGVLGFFVLVALGSDLLLRAEAGYLGGSVAAAGCMALALRSKIRSAPTLAPAAEPVPNVPFAP